GPGRGGQGTANARAGATADFGGDEGDAEPGPLPFTGVPLGATLLVASALLGGGWALRRVVRRPSG
ncbi:MAG TPA: hypothetical protein VGR10_05540, partial [Thermoleophilaceae bacterium]|nr:hypothetical protein [Thermoleophilaceae bacterium]